MLTKSTPEIAALLSIIGHKKVRTEADGIGPRANWMILNSAGTEVDILCENLFEEEAKALAAVINLLVELPE